MKTIYLASFLEKDNFGPGKIISIAEGKKPYDVEVKHIFKMLAPDPEIIEEYKKSKNVDEFVANYKCKIENFVAEVLEEATKENKSAVDVLPFEDGDTLCSWERARNPNYRPVLKPYLEQLGFKVVLN